MTRKTTREERDSERARVSKGLCTEDAEQYAVMVNTGRYLRLLDDADLCEELEILYADECRGNISLQGQMDKRIAELEAAVKLHQDVADERTDDVLRLTGEVERLEQKASRYLRACKRIHREWKGGSNVLKMCQWFLKEAEKERDRLRDSIDRALVELEGWLAGTVNDILIRQMMAGFRALLQPEPNDPVCPDCGNRYQGCCRGHLETLDEWHSRVVYGLDPDGRAMKRDEDER
jgi:hypothetical protein